MKPFYRRLKYPDEYKIDTMTITKFEKDYDNEIQYKFINAFPKSITPIPVTYGPAELLKVTVSFNYDRYIMKRLNQQEWDDVFSGFFDWIDRIF